MKATEWSRETDVVVVGAGAAGISCALTAAAEGHRVLLLAKGPVWHNAGGCTPLAQGGLAAVLPGADPAGDSAALHEADTLRAGAGLGDPAVIAEVVREAPEVIEWLYSLGARLGTGHLEGGHSRHRIVHSLSGGDGIGAEVYRVLSAALCRETARPGSRITVLEHALALDLVPGGLLAGLSTTSGPDAGAPEGTLRPGLIRAGAVVLATGGFGQAYATTTNPAGATGDGLALAWRAGAALADLEFVQFHPTVLYAAGATGQRPLITEAVRGAGALVVDAAGRQVCDPLAPRDVVSAAMGTVMARTGVAHLYLDARPVPGFADAFPSVYRTLRAGGLDPAADLIPVAPGAHYACGGIAASLDGRTSVPGLRAIGEAARTGLHGANRLASNSLTEAMIMGRRCGKNMTHSSITPVVPPPGTVPSAPGFPAVVPGRRRELTEAMSRHAGVLRTRDGLTELLRHLEKMGSGDQPGTVDLATVEASNLHTVATLVTEAALARPHSAGAHRMANEQLTEVAA